MAPRMRVRALFACAVLVAAAVVAVAHAALPQQSGTVDLATQFDVRYDGVKAADVLGEQTAPLGDFNGDGFGDVAATDEGATYAWILLGHAADAGEANDLAGPPPTAIKVSGALFKSVGHAGDVNGDG